MGNSRKIKITLKRIWRNLSPAYRTALRVEEKMDRLLADLEMPSATSVDLVGEVRRAVASAVEKQKWDSQTLTSNINLNIACTALEIHETHKASFSQFYRCHTGRDVVIVATGPTMNLYTPIKGAIHIGVNAAFRNTRIPLDYYFTTDYEHHNEWFHELKEYDFIKFFGQYSTGEYRDRFQIPEEIIEENHGRRYFQAAPNEDIHLNIEYYPLMGFYSVVFQAIHFALYTNPKRIYLVGCDCSSEGYFDGSNQISPNTAKWRQGYEKLKLFAEHFYPQTQIISVNPVGLKGLFRDTDSNMKEN